MIKPCNDNLHMAALDGQAAVLTSMGALEEAVQVGWSMITIAPTKPEVCWCF